MDYTMLVGAKTVPGSIASWANYGLAPATVVLAEAEALIYQTLRTREMLSDAVVVDLPAAASSIALPAGFLDPVALFDQYNTRMRYYRADALQRMRSVDTTSNNGVAPFSLETGQPCSYSIFGEKFQFECAADQDYKFSYIAYVTPAPLSDANTTNFLTTRYPMILRTACLAIAADFRQDDVTYQRCVTRLNNLITDAKAKDEMYLRGVIDVPDFSNCD